MTSSIGNIHRYNENLPASHARTAIDAEGALLLNSIVSDLRAASASFATKGTYDFAVAGRQIKRINALVALKYPLPDAEWKEIVETLWAMAFTADDISIVRQTALFGALSKLLSKRHRSDAVTLPWRPLWQLLQSTYLSHLNSRSRGSAVVASGHMRAVLQLVTIASRHFPQAAIAEICTVTATSFEHVNSRALFNAQAMLYCFLPTHSKYSDLPAGTAEYWVKIWATVDHCAEWDSVWATIFSRLASPDTIQDAKYGPDGTPVPGSGFPWGQHLPFLCSRLLDMLKVPVAGGQPVSKPYPYEAQALLGSVPDGVTAMSRLFMRVLTVALPPSVAAMHGDLPVKTEDIPADAPEALRRPPRPGTSDASALGHLERLLRALSSFFYPTSSHAGRMNTFIRNMTLAFAGRVGREAGVAAAEAVLAENGLAVAPAPSNPVLAGELRGGGTPPISTARIHRFVDAVLPLCVMGLYASSRGASSTVWETGATMKALAALAPARVTRELVQMASTALDPGSVNAAHQAPNALYALSILVPPLMWPVPHLAPALPDLLHAALPGIDPNDSAKTMATLAFFTSVVAVVPIVDDDDAAEANAKQAAGKKGAAADPDAVLLPAWHPASPAYTGVPVGGSIPEALLAKGCKPIPGTAAKRGLDKVPGAGRAGASGIGDVGPDGSVITVQPFAAPEAQDGDDTMGGGSARPVPSVDTPVSSEAVRELFLSARSSLPRLGEWVMLLLDRVFRVLETKEGASEAKAEARRTGKKKSDGLGSSLHTLFGSLFQQLSPRLAKQVLDRVVSWLGSCGVLEATKDVAALEQGLVMAMPGQALPKLIALHVKELTVPGVPEKLATWHARLLAGALKHSGLALLPHMPAVASAIRAAFGHTEVEVRHGGAKLLRWSLDTLLSTYEAESRSHSPQDWANLGGLWKAWGQCYGWGTGEGVTGQLEAAGLLQPGVRATWHIPSAPERAAALELVQEFLVGPMMRLQEFAATYGPSSDAPPPSFGDTTDETNAGAAGTSSSSSDAGAGGQASPTAGQTSIPAAQLTTLSDKLRNDIATVLAAFRGAVFGLTDGSGPNGDDGVICVGTAGQALLFDSSTGKALFASGDATGRAAGGAGGSSTILPLRHAVALSVDKLLRSVSSHPDFSRDVKALSLAIQVAFRTVSARGPKMFKTVNAKRDMANFKRFYREPLADNRARHFSRAMWAAAAAHAGYTPASSTAIYTALGGTHQTARAYQITRLVYHMNRRQAEALYAVPKAIHWGQGSAGGSGTGTGTSTQAQGRPMSSIGEAGEGDGDVDDLLEGGEGAEAAAAEVGGMADVEADYLDATEGEVGTPAAAAGGVSSEAMGVGVGSPVALPKSSVDLRGAVPVFGRTAISKLVPAEHPYASLMASAFRLALHPYDTVRRKAGSHCFTMIAVFSWLRKGLQTSAIMRLEKLANKAAASAAAARAGGLRSAAESVLRAAAADGQLPAIPGGIPPTLLASIKTSLTLEGVPANLQGMAAQAAGLLAAAAGPEPGPAAAAGAGPTSPALGPSPAGSATSSTTAATAPLSHNVVFGLVMLGFSSPAGLISDWDGLERALKVLLRSSILIRGLPIDKHGDALANFGMAVARLVEGWHALPIPAGHPRAGHWSAVRERLLKHLLSSAAPQAFLAEGDFGRSPAAIQPLSSPVPVASPSAGGPRLVLQADGSKGPSAAPLPESPLHWRYELMAGAFICMLLAPKRAMPCSLAIDTAKGVDSDLHPLQGAEAARTAMTLAPEPVWMWVLSNVLSDNVLLRMQALDCLVQLLHNHQAARAARIGPGPSSLPRVHALLTDPTYISQFVAAVSIDHSERSGEGGGTPGVGSALDTMLAMPGMRELATPLECARAFVEFSRHPLQGGAVSSIVHMLLFELLACNIPDCMPVVIDALGKLGKGSSSAGGAGAGEASNNHASEASTTIEEQGYVDVNMEGGGIPTQPVPATGGIPKAAAHDPATLRSRQATVAEAFAGFFRALSGMKAPGANPSADGPGSGKGGAGTVVFTTADASLPALAASSGLSGTASPAPAPTTAVDLDASMHKLLALVAPLWDTVGLDWAGDWVNCIRYAIRQRHPSQVAVLVRYVFAAAAAAVEASGAASSYPADYDKSGLEALLSLVAGDAGAVTGAGAGSSSGTGQASSSSASSSSSSFAAQVRWLTFVQALVFEFFATNDGRGASGTLPGVTAAEEAASEVGLHATLPALLKRVPVAGQVALIEESTSPNVVPSRVAAASLCRQMLPGLLRALPHPFKACREEISRTVMVMLECSWGLSDSGIRSPIQQPVLAGVTGVNGQPVPVIAEPVSTGWTEWAPAVVASVLHVVSAARPTATAAGPVNEGAAASSTGQSASDKDKERSKWGSRVLESSLYLLNDGLGSDTPILTPIVLACLPVLLTSVAHPDRDLSKLAGAVGASTAHTLSLARPVQPGYLAKPGTASASLAADPDALFFRRVEGLLGKYLPQNLLTAGATSSVPAQAAGQGSGTPPSTGPAPTGLGDCPTANDILVRLLEVYAVTAEVDKKDAGEGEEGAGATAGPAKGAATAKATAVKAPPPALASPVVLAVPPVSKTSSAGGAGSGTQWFIRRAALDLSVPLRARNLLSYSNAADAVLAGAVESRLDDKQIEVSDAAGNTLVGFVMTMPQAQRVVLGCRLLALVNTKLPKKVPAPAPSVPADHPDHESHRKWKTRQTRQLRKRLAGVLGVAAVVRASPFDVPEYLPSILSALSHHAADPAPVGPAVKDCIAEFRRTHADGWEQHKERFSPEQLSDIMNVTAGGTYFA